MLANFDSDQDLDNLDSSNSLNSLTLLVTPHQADILQSLPTSISPSAIFNLPQDSKESYVDVNAIDNVATEELKFDHHSQMLATSDIKQDLDNLDSTNSSDNLIFLVTPHQADTPPISPTPFINPSTDIEDSPESFADINTLDSGQDLDNLDSSYSPDSLASLVSTTPHQADTLPTPTVTSIPPEDLTEKSVDINAIDDVVATEELQYDNHLQMLATSDIKQDLDNLDLTNLSDNLTSLVTPNQTDTLPTPAATFKPTSITIEDPIESALNIKANDDDVVTSEQQVDTHSCTTSPIQVHSTTVTPPITTTPVQVSHPVPIDSTTISSSTTWEGSVTSISTIPGAIAALVKATETRNESLSSSTLKEMIHFIDTVNADIPKIKSLGRLGACEYVVTIITSFLNSSIISEYGLRIIYILGSDTANKDRFYRCGLLELIIKLMIIYDGSQIISEWAFKVIVVLTTSENKNGIISSSELCGAVVNSLHVHVGSTIVMEWGCRVMMSLCHQHPMNKSKLGDAGACEVLVVAALHKNSSNSSVTSWACQAIGELCYQHDTNRERFGTAGACEATLLVLRAFPESSDILNSALLAIENLSMASQANQNRYGEAGTCEIITSIILNFSKKKESWEVIQSACKVIRSLCLSHPKNLMTFGDANICEIIITWLYTNPPNTTSKESNYMTALSCSHTQWGWLAIASLANLEENRVRLGAINTCEAVLKTIKAKGASKDCICWCCQVIANLAINTENCLRFGNIGACKTLVDVLHTYGSNNVNIAESVCLAIARLAVVEDNRTWLGAAGVCDLIITGPLSKYVKEIKVVEYVCQAVYYLSLSHSSNLSKLGATSCYKVIPKALQKHIAIVAIAEWGCMALANLSLDDSIRSKLITHGASEVITSSLYRFCDNPVVVEWCFKALNNMSIVEGYRSKIASYVIQSGNFVLQSSTYVLQSGINVLQPGINISQPVYYDICEAIMKALQCHKYDSKLIELGCQLVTVMAENVTVSSKLDSLGICELLAEIVKLQIDNESVIHRCCSSISSLASNNESNRTRLGAAGVCENLLEIILKYSAFREIIVVCVKAVYYLAEVNDNKVRLGNSDACEILIQMFSLHSTSEILLEYSLHALGTLAMNHAVNGNKIGAVDGCSIIMTALSQHSGHIGVMKWGVRAIAYLADCEQNKIQFGAIGTCEFLITANSASLSSEFLCEYLLLAVANLAAGNVENMEKLGAIGACDVIVKVLRLHTTSEAVVQAACRAVDSMSSKHDLLEAAGVCEEMVVVLTSHPRSATIATLACKAIYFMSADAKNRLKVGSAGACEAVTSSLGKHAGVDLVGSVLQWSTGSEEVAQWGCSAIHMLAVNHKGHQLRLAAAGACEAVVRVLLRYGESEAVGISGCRAVVTLAYKDTNIQNRLGNCGACKAVTLILQLHPSSLVVAEWACRAVGILAENNEANTLKLGSAGACDSMSVTMQAHQGSMAVAASGCGAIASLAENPTFAYRLGEAGSCEAIVAALRRHSNNEKIAMKGFLAVINLSSNEGNVAWLGPTGACEAVLQAIQRHTSNANIVALGLHVIGNLAKEEGNRSRLGVAGACSDVVGYLGSYFNDSKVVHMGCRAIQHLAIGRDNVLLLKAALANEIVVKAALQYIDTVNSRITEQTCSTCIELANHTTNHRRLREAGVSDVIVNIMRDMKGVEAVALQVSFLAKRFSEGYSKNIEALNTSGVCEAMIPLLDVHIKNEVIVDNIIGTIISMTSRNISNRILIGDLGGWRILLVAMKEHLKSENLTRSLCVTATIMCGDVSCEENRKRFLAAGISESIFAVIKKYYDNEKIAESIFLLIDKLLLTSSIVGSAQDIIGNTGISKLIVRVLQTHERSELVAAAGFMAITRLAANHPVNQERLGVAGTPRALVMMVLRHAGNKKVYELGCRAVISLSQNHEANRLKIISAGGNDYLNHVFSASVEGEDEEEAEKMGDITITNKPHSFSVESNKETDDEFDDIDCIASV